MKRRAPFGLVAGAILILLAFNNCSSQMGYQASDGTDSNNDYSEFLPGIDKKIEYNTNLIEAGEFLTVDTNKTGFFAVGTEKIAYKFYRNKAYKCGMSGYHTFLVLQKNSLQTPAPQWVFLHGGGVGYCYKSPQTGANVCNDDPSLNEESADELLNDVSQNAFKKNGGKNVIMAKRISEGYRVIALSMCDHDLYGGLGTPFPNNPYWSGESQSVDGLLASMAAVEFVSRNYPYNGYTYAHGSSAGAAGAYNLSLGFLNNGKKLNGVLLDSMTLGERRQILNRYACTPTAQQAISIGLTPEQGEEHISAKIGVLASDLKLTLDSQLDSNGLNYFIIDGITDQFCCGNVSAVAEATSSGFNNNCQWYHEKYEKILGAAPKTKSRVMVVPNMGHVVTPKEDVDSGTNHQAKLEEWFQEIFSQNPPKFEF